MLGTAARKAMTMTDDRIVQAINSCTAALTIYYIEATILFETEIVIDESLSEKRVRVVDRDASGRLVTNLHTVG